MTTKYIYKDASDNPVFRVVRVDNADGTKTFVQQHPLPDGTWAKGRNNAPYVLYELPNVLAAEEIWLVEGEKCADALLAVNITATTKAGGATRGWTEDEITSLAGKHVIIIPDNDAPGQRYCIDAVEALTGVAASIRILPLPGLAEKQDIYDWLEKGGDPADLRTMAAGAPRVTTADIVRPAKPQRKQEPVDDDQPELSPQPKGRPAYHDDDAFFHVVDPQFTRDDLRDCLNRISVDSRDEAVAIMHATKNEGGTFDEFLRWRQRQSIGKGKPPVQKIREQWDGAKPGGTANRKKLIAMAQEADPEFNTKSYLEDLGNARFEQLTGTGRFAGSNPRPSSAGGGGGNGAPPNGGANAGAAQEGPQPGKSTGGPWNGKASTDTKPKKQLFIREKDFAAAWVAAEYLIDGLVQRGYCYSLTSPTGHGKTALALLMSASVGTGRKFAGLETLQGKVGYFAAENPNDVQARWIGLREEMNIEATDVYFCPETVNLATAKDRITTEAKAFGGFDLIIVDTSQAFFQGEDENSNSQMVTHAKAMRHLTMLPGNPCVIILCHPVKNPSRDNLLPRGGGGFLAEVDGNLTLWSDNGNLTLHHQGKFRSAGFAPMNFALRAINPHLLKDKKGRQIPTVIAEYVTEEDAAKRRIEDASDQDKVMVFLRSRRGKGTQEEIARWCGWYFKDKVPARSKVNKIIKALKKDGYLADSRRGGIVITEKGKKEFAQVFKKADIGSEAEDDDAEI